MHEINLSGFNISIKEVTKAYEEGVYSDSPANRKLGRVGMTYKDYENLTKNKTENKYSDMPFGEIFNGYKMISKEKWQKVIEDDKREMTLSEHFLEIVDCEYAIDKIDKGTDHYATKQEGQEAKRRLTNRIELNEWICNKYKNNSDYNKWLSDSQVGKNALISPAERKRIKQILLNEEASILRETKQQYEMCASFDKLGNKLFEQKGEERQIAISAENIEKLQNAEVFTHNHPSSNCFSWQDLNIAFVKNIKQMRAIASDAYGYGRGAFVFEKGDLDSRNTSQFLNEHESISKDVGDEFSAKIDKLSYKIAERDDYEALLNHLYSQANQLHWTEVMRRVSQLPKYKSCKFYFEDEKGNKKEIREASIVPEYRW